MRRLARAVLTGTLASASKITGSLEEIIKNAAGLQDEELGDFHDRGVHTVSMSRGLIHGGDVLVDSIVTGFSGLVEAPISGFQKHGLPGAMTGTMKGLVGLIAAPLSGTLGAVSIVTESARQTALFHHSGRPIGRRRKMSRRSHIVFVEVSNLNFDPEDEQISTISPSEWTCELPGYFEWDREKHL